MNEGLNFNHGYLELSIKFLLIRYKRSSNSWNYKLRISHPAYSCSYCPWCGSFNLLPT